MIEIEKTCTVYQAFDGKEFNTEGECENYERELALKNVLNLKHFDIHFPMQDDYASCVAYRINSANEFKMFQTYVLDMYYEMDPDYCVYEGNGWYVLQGGDNAWANVEKLSNLMCSWNRTMETIAKNVIDFD